jgi:hypothetical protein
MMALNIVSMPIGCTTMILTVGKIGIVQQDRLGFLSKMMEMFTVDNA